MYIIIYQIRMDVTTKKEKKINKSGGEIDLYEKYYKVGQEIEKITDFLYLRR